MLLSIEGNQSLVALYHAGEPVAEICANVGIARSMFYAWIKSYKGCSKWQRAMASGTGSLLQSQ